MRRLCRRFNHSSESLDDLFQVGSIGLLKAIEKFDPNRGSKFLAFAVPVIVGELKNYQRDQRWAVKIPRKVQTQKHTVERTVERLRQILGRGPRIPEIAEASGLSPEEIYDTFEAANCRKPLSLDAPSQDGESDGYSSEDLSSLLDYLGSEDPGLRELIDRVDIKNILKCLDRREKTIINLKFYTGLSQTEIAKVLGISQMHVSRLQRSALSKLRLNLTA